ncbi:MAG: hypothetical protein ABEN55_17135 [Bradymonadaceae bacterium]
MNNDKDDNILTGEVYDRYKEICDLAGLRPPPRRTGWTWPCRKKSFRTVAKNPVTDPSREMTLRSSFDRF